jgi:hypothetical protein
MKYIDLKVGMELMADDGFTCLKEDEIVTVKEDIKGRFYVDCSDGKHLLDGQKDINGNLVGFEIVSEPCMDMKDLIGNLITDIKIKCCNGYSVYEFYGNSGEVMFQVDYDTILFDSDGMEMDDSDLEME